MRGDKMSGDFRTEVRIAYDDRNIYFAFHCFDHEPDRIRTTVSKRDNAFSDDWIAISLDSNGTGQTAYHLFSNPSASQMDALNTSASGEQFDADFVWFSAAKTTADGYVVEVQIPLQTLRFSGGDRVRMGLVFFRKISRIGISYAWPEMLPGQWVFDRPAHLLFANLKPRRLMELLPSVTYGVNQARASVAAWEPALDTANVGVSGKFGVTSSVTLDGTVNPDFSQVESDAFQVEVNQRYPVFYSEKRPFFMEGMGLFNIAGTGGDGNMRTAVHTRRIVDPNWGSKLTGTVGKTTFGVLNAQDDHPRGCRRSRRRVQRSRQAVHDWPRHLRNASIRLPRRDLHRHAITRAATTWWSAATCRCGPRPRSRCRRRSCRRRRASRTTTRAATACRRRTATRRDGSRCRARPSTTIAISRWTPRSTTAPVSRRRGSSAK